MNHYINGESVLSESSKFPTRKTKKHRSSQANQQALIPPLRSAQKGTFIESQTSFVYGFYQLQKDFLKAYRYNNTEACETFFLIEITNIVSMFPSGGKVCSLEFFRLVQKGRKIQELSLHKFDRVFDVKWPFTGLGPRVPSKGETRLD